MGKKDCPSFWGWYEVKKFRKLSMTGKLIYLVLLVTIFGYVFYFFGKMDNYYLYVPTGTYMVYIEYILLVVTPLIAWHLHKRALSTPDACKYGLLAHMKDMPKLHLFFQFIFILFVVLMFFYSIGIAVSTLNLDSEAKYNSYNVKVESIGFKGRAACRGNMKTDFLDQLNISHETFYHKFIHRFNFDTICTRFSGSNQVIKVGRKVNLEVKESPWGIYVYRIP